MTVPTMLAATDVRRIPRGLCFYQSIFLSRPFRDQSTSDGFGRHPACGEMVTVICSRQSYDDPQVELF
jgi:hypothetical protein